MITTERLQERLAELEAQQKMAIAQANAIQGAIEQVKAFLKELEPSK